MSSSQGGEEVPPLSSVDLNIYILSEAIRSSMESSMEILAMTMQKNALIMANTIQEGFASGNSLAEEPSKKRARTSIEVAHGDSSGSSLKRPLTTTTEARPTQVVVALPSRSEREGGEDDDNVSLLDPTDSFSDPEFPPPLPSTLDRATADFQVEETVGPPVSEEMALRICHIAKTPLLPEKLKLRMDRELCPSNTPVAAKKVNQSLFNKRGGPMATVRGHDLQLQTVQKLMTKAMLPLVRMADRFCLAESDETAIPNPTEALNACLDSFSLLAGANLQMDQLRREGFKSALPPQYKGLTNAPEV